MQDGEDREDELQVYEWLWEDECLGVGEYGEQSRINRDQYLFALSWLVSSNGVENRGCIFVKA